MTGERPYTVKTAAERLACSQATVRNLCRAGKLGSFRIGVGAKAYFRIPASAIEEFERGGLSETSASSASTSASTGEVSEQAWGPRIVRLSG